MVQQKAIFEIFKKSNMVAVIMVMATVIHNLQLNTETYARVRFYGDLPIMVQQKPIFQIF